MSLMQDNRSAVGKALPNYNGQQVLVVAVGKE